LLLGVVAHGHPAANLLCVDDPMNLAADEIDLIQTYRQTDAKGRAVVRKKANVEADMF